MPTSLELEMQGQIRGQAEQLQKAFLNTLGWKGVRKLEQFATVNAARAWAKSVRAEAPAKSGALAKTVRGRRSRYTRPGAVVGPTVGRKHAWWARFVIRGTKPHTIPTVTAGNLFSDRRFIQHPGTQGDPFVDRAIAKNYSVGANAFGATIVMLMTDEVKRAKVLGFEIEYANRTAAQWQGGGEAREWISHWSDPDFIGPLTTTESYFRSRIGVGSDKIKAIAASQRHLQLRQDAKVFGIKPNMNNLRIG